jgi:hypothetical protein
MYVLPQPQPPKANPILIALGAATILVVTIGATCTAAESCRVSDWPLQNSTGSTALQTASLERALVIASTRHSSAGVQGGGMGPTPVYPPPARTFPPRPVAQSDQERLHFAVLDNDVVRVRTLLKSSSIDVDAPIYPRSRDSLLDLAARYGLPDIVQALIDKGARVRAEAATASQVDIHPLLSTMIWLKLHIESRGKPGVYTAAATASPEHYESIVHILLKAGADPNEIPSPVSSLGPLGLLADTPAFEGDERFAQELLSHGAALDGTATTSSALLVAAQNGFDRAHVGGSSPSPGYAQ